LGTIVHFDELRPIIKDGRKTFIFVESKKFLHSYVKVPIESDKIIKIEDTGVWFDILKKDFDVRRSEVKKLEENKDEAFNKTEPVRFWFSTQSPRDAPKERRKK